MNVSELHWALLLTDLGSVSAGAGVRGVELEALDDAEELVQVEVCGRLARRHAQHVLPRPGDDGPGVRGQGVRGAGAQRVHCDGAAPGQCHGHQGAGVAGGRHLIQQRLVHLELWRISEVIRSDLKHTQQWSGTEAGAED